MHYIRDPWTFSPAGAVLFAAMLCGVEVLLVVKYLVELEGGGRLRVLTALVVRDGVGGNCPGREKEEDGDGIPAAQRKVSGTLQLFIYSSAST
jgi:hypothetical protein